MRSTSTKPIEPIAHTFLSSAAHTSQLSANTHQTESRKDTFKPWRLSAIRDNSSLRFWIISPQKMAKTITKNIEKILSTDLLSAAYSYKDQTIKGAGLASIFMPIALISVPQARAQAIRAVCVQNAGRGLGWKVSLLWMRGWWKSFCSFSPHETKPLVEWDAFDDSVNQKIDCILLIAINTLHANLVLRHNDKQHQQKKSFTGSLTGTSWKN